MRETRTTFCRLCEATCGLEVTVEGSRVTAIVPDRDHVVSRGYACVKGLRFAEVQHSPDRLLHPMKRLGSRWVQVSWDEAIGEIGGRLRRLVGERGPQTAACFMGSPAGTSVVSATFRTGFFAGLGSRQMYGVGSVDCNNKLRVSEDMYGSPFRLTFPDLEHVGFLMILGSNPAVSHMSLVHAPRPVELLRAVAERGGRVVVIDPRRTETARAAGEHHFIRPDTDVFFLAAFCRELIARGGVDRGRVGLFMSGFDALRAAVEPWTPERVAPVTGIAAEALRDLVRAHRRAEGAALYCSTGVNQGTHGTLAFWLAEVINAISGNLDAWGGVLMGRGLFDQPAMVKPRGTFARGAPLRPGGPPSIVDTFPVGVLTDEILREGRDRVTALFVEAGNPVLVCPNPGGRLTRALRRLDLLVSIDLFRNETGNLAHYILPAPTFLERADLPNAIQTFAGNQPRRYAYYAAPVLPPPDDVREEWWIWTRLARAAGVPLFGNRALDVVLQASAALQGRRATRRFALSTPRLLGLMTAAAGLGTHRSFRQRCPHGRLLEPNRPGDFLGTQRVLTDDGLVHLAPPDLIAAMSQLARAHVREYELVQRGAFKLISKRSRRSMNSWLHNFEGYVEAETNPLHLHPADAAQLGLAEGDLAVVASAHGQVEAPVTITDEVMPRTVALAHGWGHADADGLRIARQRPGVNSNLLAGDGPENIEPLSGMSHLSGIVVEVRRAAGRGEP